MALEGDGLHFIVVFCGGGQEIRLILLQAMMVAQRWSHLPCRLRILRQTVM